MLAEKNSNIFLIDYAINTKSGMHEQLEKASKRNIIFPAYRFRSTLTTKLLFKVQKSPLLSYILSTQLFGNWKIYLKKEKVSSIVVIANYLTINIVKWINKNYPEINIHVYYFNIVSKDVPISFFEKLDCEIWTFDKKDSDKYGIGLVNFPLPIENFSTLPVVTKYKYDAIFIGADKGRLEEILSIKSILDRNGLITKFHIVATLGEEVSTNYSYNEFLSYHEILKITNESKVIVDIVQEGQTGGTIRTIEALFLKKKLITNNLTVIHEPYYDSQNIFIIGKDDESRLMEFILNPYQKINYNIQQHELKAWLLSF